MKKWTVEYMVREREGDYLAAVEQLEGSYKALVEALQEIAKSHGRGLVACAQVARAALELVGEDA